MLSGANSVPRNVKTNDAKAEANAKRNQDEGLQARRCECVVIFLAKKRPLSASGWCCAIFREARKIDPFHVPHGGEGLFFPVTGTDHEVVSINMTSPSCITPALSQKTACKGGLFSEHLVATTGKIFLPKNHFFVKFTF